MLSLVCVSQPNACIVTSIQSTVLCRTHVKGKS